MLAWVNHNRELVYHLNILLDFLASENTNFSRYLALKKNLYAQSTKDQSSNNILCREFKPKQEDW